MSHSTLPSTPRRRRGLLLVVAGAFVLAGGVALLLHSSGSSAKEAGEKLPVVAVAEVAREDLRQTLTLSAEFRPYQQVSLHAKVAGYLESISVDVGDHVKAGQAIGELDVPEMQNEMEKAHAAVSAAQSEIARAQAGSTEAHMAFT